LKQNGRAAEMGCDFIFPAGSAKTDLRLSNCASGVAVWTTVAVAVDKAVGAGVAVGAISTAVR
jgi:hypothetical protein